MIGPIIALLAILYVSYCQVIVAYPSYGGAYTVAKENLSSLGSLVAAAALMIDYVLNVAVGISAGVVALTSSVPSRLHVAVGPWHIGTGRGREPARPREAGWQRMAQIGPFAVEKHDPPTFPVAHEERNRMTDRALRFAMTLSPDVLAVHRLRRHGPDEDDDLRQLREQFGSDITRPLAATGKTPPRLMIVTSPWRD